MQYRRMPRGKDELSILGYGIMRLPLKAGRIDRKRAASMVLRALDAGVNYLDTAVPYHGGQSEPFLGRLLAESGRRESVNIATKLPHWQVKNRIEMDKVLGQQLTRLRSDRIDYYLIHNLIGSSWDKVLTQGVREFLDAAKASGKIRYAGFSWHGTPVDFPKVVDGYDWDFVQIQYNILDERRQAGVAGLKYAASRGLGVIVMEPLRGGKLAAKIPPAAAKIWKTLPERSPAAWALSWVWNHPEVSLLLSGMGRESHLEENLSLAAEALPGMINERELDVIAEVQSAYRDIKAVGCTGCRYCMPCPFGVSIPEVFDWYNEWKTFNKPFAQRMFYLATVGGMLSGRSGLASQCVSCGACLPKCPQELPIPSLMSGIASDYEGRLGRILVRLGSRYIKNRTLP